MGFHSSARALFFSCALIISPTFVSAQSLVERGSYLAGLMTCHNCHTPIGPNGPDFTRTFAGGSQTFDTPAFTVKGANITPDAQTGIGKWSDAELKKALRTGVRPNGVAIAPIMPTGFYEIMTEADLDALVAYIRSVKPIANAVSAPVYRKAVVREVMPGGEKPMPESAFADKAKRGFYLATIAHCMECHSPIAGDGPDLKRSLGKGGQKFEGPWGQVTSRNITSHQKAGLGAWTNDEIKRAITEGISKDGSRLKPPMGYRYYAKMTPDDLDAIVAYLRTVPPLE